MHISKNLRTAINTLVGGVLLVSLMLTPTAYGQVANNYLRITGVDISQFPDVAVTVYGQGLDGGLTSAPLTLSENGEPQTLKADASQEIGVQVSLVVDASSNITNRGVTGSTRLDEVKQIAGDLTRSGILLDAKDYLNAIAFERENNKAVPAVLEGWSTDHQGVINQIVAYNANAENTTTPLIEQIFFALEQFDDASLPNNLQRHLIVFSDGTDILSGTEPDDLPRIAAGLGVRVHTVWFRNTDAGAEANMRRIAALTGGQTFTISANEPVPTGIWAAIQASQSQRILTYRSSNASPREVSVTAKSTTGSLLRATQAFPAINIRPASIQVLKPLVTSITRSGPSWETPITDLTPDTLAAEIAISWPDKRVRNITGIDYLIDGTVLFPVEGGGLSVVLPINALDGGNHTLRVRVTDELGLRGESDPINFTVVIDQPAPPNFEATSTAEARSAQSTRTADLAAASTREANVKATADARATTQALQAATSEANVKATADARATTQALQAATSEANVKATADARATTQAAEAATTEANVKATADARATTQAADLVKVQEEAEEQVQTLSYVSMFSTAVGLIALIFAVVAWRNPKVRKRATEFVTGTIQAVTEPFFGGRGGGPPKSSTRARLVLINGDSSVPQTIDLHKEITKIGRDPALAVDVVINDRRISRLHAKIIDRGTQFELVDEGSTGGTWINDSQVPMNGQMLRDGDEINFGPIRYRFEMLGGSDVTQTAMYEGLGDPTDPYIPGVGDTQADMQDSTQIAGAYDFDTFGDLTEYDLSNFEKDNVDSTQYMVFEDDGEDDDDDENA